jgi:peptidoglycan/LPS O-acetylase OafA/YrhL
MSTTATSTQPSATVTHPSPRLRLEVLDGIRGLSALYVALFHAMGYAGHTTTPQTELTGPMAFVGAMLSYGSYAVPIFIVLSGFCLMLPLAQRNIQSISGGVVNYIRRRAWRILPSYYAMLFLSLGLIALVPVLQTQQNTAWDTKIPVTTAAIISHLLLIHDFHPGWIYKIDGPMWSIAIEWQIYFLFPALLLPILRRSNIVVMVGVALAFGLLPHFLLPAQLTIDFMHPWFLGLFAMGAAGAVVTFSQHPTLVKYRIDPWFGRLNSVLTISIICGLAWQKDWMNWHDYITETLIGLAVTGWLIQYASAIRQAQRRSWSQRVLESRPLVKLGVFSYSIYLVHNPLQAWINLETLSLDLSANARLAVQICLATPLAIACAYVFYLLIERRFMHTRERVVPVASVMPDATLDQSATAHTQKLLDTYNNSPS